MGNQLCKHQFYVKVCLICVVESLISLLFSRFVFLFFVLFGNSAKDFPGIVPLSARGEDQRNASAQRVSPLLLFTSGFFQQKETQRCGEICVFVSLALLYTWLSFRVREITVTGRRSNKRKLLGRASRRRRTDRRTPARRWLLQGRLLFHGLVLRSEGLHSQAGWDREGREKRGFGMT